MSRARLVLVNGDPDAGSAVAAQYVAGQPGVVRLEADPLASAHLAAGHDVLVPQLVVAPEQREVFRQVADAAGADFVELRIEPGAEHQESLRRLEALLAETRIPVDRSIDQREIGSLRWTEVAARLAPARSYWLSTTGRDGAPQVAPVWGVMVEETLHLYSERHTAKARNLASDSRFALHLGDAEDVLILHGTVEDLGIPTSRPEVMEAFRAKYADPGDAAYLPDADPAFDVLWALRPTTALTWRLESFEESRRRWSS